MPVSLETLETNLRNAIPILHLEIIDQSSGCGENYAILVVSEVKSIKSPYQITNNFVLKSWGALW